MNKKLLAVAVAGAFAASGAAFADANHGMHSGVGATVNGHIFSTFVLTDDFGQVSPGQPNENEKKFHTDAELNFKAKIADGVYARIDLDINHPGVDSFTQNIQTGDSVMMEQAYGAWKIHDMAKLQIGRFNSGLGIEAHDQYRLSTISHGQVRHNLSDAMPVADGNNVDGLAVHLMAGPAKVTLGLLNDIGNVDEENSLLLRLSGEVIDGLNLGLGVVTQDDDQTNVGNIINFNASYGMAAGDMPFSVWLDYLTASEVLDSTIEVGATLGIVDNLDLTFRYSMTEYDFGGGATEDWTTITLAARYTVTDGMDLRLEWRNDEFENGGSEDGDSIMLSAAFWF